jgi:hypothetical protein
MGCQFRGVTGLGGRACWWSLLGLPVDWRVLAAGHADRNSTSLEWYWFILWLLGLGGCTYFHGLLNRHAGILR